MPDTRIRGYGIAWSEFVRRAFPGERIADPANEFEARLSRARSDRLTIPHAEFVDLSSRFASNVVLEKCLMRREPRTRSGDSEYLPATHLFRFVGNPKRLVLFLPDMTFFDDWFRGEHEPLAHGTARRQPGRLMPFVTARMDSDGRPLPYPTDEGHPLVPIQLRWWLTSLNVLPQHTINGSVAFGVAQGFPITS